LSLTLTLMTNVKLLSFTSKDSPINSAHQEFAQYAVGTLEGIINSNDFNEKILEYPFTGRSFSNGREVINASNKLIADIIATGKEMDADADDSIDLQVKLINLPSTVAARVFPPDPTIYTNTSLFISWYEEPDSLSLAAHWMHEWLHVSGFQHTSDEIDEMDVPYAIGNLIIQIGLGTFRAALRQNEKSNGKVPGQGYVKALKAHHDEIARPAAQLP
jgi:hypothetical protein